MDNTKAARIIRDHYRLTRQVTPTEVASEIANLQRKADTGGLDDRSGLLAARLNITMKDA